MARGVPPPADPISGDQTTLVANFCDAVAVLVFFTLGAHRWMLWAIHDSLVQWPVGRFLSGEFIRDITVSAVAQSFSMAFQLAAPLLVLLFLIALIMAIMARLVPEVNVLILSFPLRVGTGLVGLTLLMPWVVAYAGDVSRTMIQYMSSYPAGG